MVVVLVGTLAEVKSDKLGDPLVYVQAGVPVPKQAATLEVVVAATVNDTLRQVDPGTIIDNLAKRATQWATQKA